MRSVTLLLLLFALVFSVGAQSFTPLNTPSGTDILLFPSAYTGQKGQYEMHIEMSPFRTHAAVSLTNRLMLASPTEERMSSGMKRSTGIPESSSL